METVEIKHLKCAYGTHSTDIEQHNSHFLLSCFQTEIWKAKKNFSQNPLKVGKLLAISSQ